MAEFKIKGSEELMRNLEKLGSRFSAHLEVAVKAGALIVQNVAKEKCPKLTGTLSRSIHMETAEKSAERVSVQVGTDVEYATKIEYGGSRKAPEGYLRPAYDENQENVQKEIGKALNDVLRGAL